MHTATHTTHQLATFHTDAARRHTDAANERTHRAGRPRRTGRTIAGTVAALIVGTTLVASPATAAEGFDTYTGGDKLISGLADGWFDPTDRPVEDNVPANVR